jgi:hypothetical protein
MIHLASLDEAEQQLATLEGLARAAGLAAEVAAASTHNRQQQRAASQKQKGHCKSFFSSQWMCSPWWSRAALP